MDKPVHGDPTDGECPTLSVAGQVVADPMSIWRRYASDYPGTILGYDLADPGDANALTPEEAWRSRIINSRLTGSERDQIVERSGARELWERVPAGADLAMTDPADPGGLFTDAATLYWHFTVPPIPGVRVAKVHKILHPKRPALYPILDLNLKRLYRALAEPWVGLLGHLDVTINDSPPYWAAFRDDLICNSSALNSYRQRLAAEEQETVRLLGKLTSLRLLDIVAWEVATGQDE